MRIIILLLPLLFISCGEHELEYTRSQCIVKTEIFWDKNLTKKQQLKINNDFYKAKLLMWMNRDRLKLLIPHVSFSGFPDIDKQKFPKFMYSQYNDECENKENMLFIFLEHIKFYVPNFPKYKVTSEVVEPGIRTIETRGKKYWIDG
ncbi:hypothetical protein THERMOT_1876 [Bathymodiolus thermophilus thioautotrophic gill symbiont]|uniref:Lipoprotein n=1 Tax=Bathymodiolus thermophilus thioautotrophic gill symbiont TaxID=2360 RepID=A0A1J5TVJ4_9GAMM|nr:hypothetical protein [Bathymodiolus thermophilus thioautotrophic gill symbiont]OIR24848.1 hypothetical protein BGC33_04675 [Bathymodiolus thermophilus thioautotrophic gill symbiont]CAB5503923.1 hypothetical protein THERMOT_1876 [Bathymodiolus thermophilus thioautotrophic gill symbiont]CAB5505990.1 hypothetical protein THERMOS_2223 [Bathymodiolus thermophilus thioautotrophic gill symbiont]